jgi:putative DNA primase/helicase
MAHVIPAIGGNAVLSPLTDFTFDDVSNARLFASRFNYVLRWQSDAGRWLTWNQTHWEPDNTGLVMRIAQDFAKSLYDIVPDLARSKEEFQTAFRHATRTNKLAGIRAFLELAKSELDDHIKRSLDQEPFLLNTLSGTVDLRTGELRKHRPTDY